MELFICYSYATDLLKLMRYRENFNEKNSETILEQSDLWTYDIFFDVGYRVLTFSYLLSGSHQVFSITHRALKAEFDLCYI